jgi:hypothetical protein
MITPLEYKVFDWYKIADYLVKEKGFDADEVDDFRINFMDYRNLMNDTACVMSIEHLGNEKFSNAIQEATGEEAFVCLFSW